RPDPAEEKRFVTSLHDALNRLAHLVAGPVERAERAVADGAVRSDEVARWQDARAPGLRRLRVAVEKPGKARRHRVDERASGAGDHAGRVGQAGEGTSRKQADTSDHIRTANESVRHP